MKVSSNTVLILFMAVQLRSNGEELKSAVLSRKKRFLVFPEGSSVQLVLCNTFPNISPIGDIVLWGYTAALAYELPQDPYSPFEHHADPLHRRIDTKTLYFTDRDGNVIFKKPYERRKFIVNPAFAKRSADVFSTPRFEKGNREKFKIDRNQMHASKNKRDFLKSDRMEESSVEFHRISRGSLYHKIETMLRGLGSNGRKCLLKTLCLVGRTHNHPQGSFFQEILRAVFTLPKGLREDDYTEYDEATNIPTNCEEAYPECSEPIEPSAQQLNY